jgi:hypothetical protein
MRTIRKRPCGNSAEQFIVIAIAGNAVALTALKDDHPKLPQRAIESNLAL